MQFLSSGSGDEQSQDLVYQPHSRLSENWSPSPASAQGTDQDVGSSFNLRYVLRKYWLLLTAMVILGVSGGFAAIVLVSPKYESHVVLEVQGGTSGLLKNEQGAADVSEVGIQTQVVLLRSGSFRRSAADRVASETIPLAPTGQDFFSRVRQRIHPATQDPLEAAKNGLNMAYSTFDARPIAKTRLIDLVCESTSPDVAAQFVNSLARAYVEANNSARMQTAQKTSEWLAAQIDDTKTKVTEAEERLRDFVQASGNVFAGQEVTLDDTKLAQLKGELSRIQADRIAKQTRYELTTKNSPETIAEILDDGVVRGYKTQLEGLRREKARLEITYTPKHEKVRQIDAQIAVLQKNYDNELNNLIKRIKNDYEAALKQERLLNNAYVGQAQRVGSEAGKAAQYAALKREVEMERQMYQSLLVQQSEASMSSSVPLNPIRIVEQANPSDRPSSPVPVLDFSLSTMLGLVMASGIIFLKERSDRSIKQPGVSRRLFNAPELGVIPNVSFNGNGARKLLKGSKDHLNGSAEDSAVVLLPEQPGPAMITESFRSTLASILRHEAAGQAHKVILVTSPGPAEGKTTVVQNLGMVLAETGRKVLLIDADFRRPHLHRKFGVPNERGLIDLLAEDRPLDVGSSEPWEVPTGIPGLSILPNRITQHNVAKALYSPRLRAVLEMLIKRYDMVLVDAPPILSIADARIIAPLTDALILVLRCGVTDREAAFAAYQTIQDDGLSLLGTVLTGYDASLDRKRQYYYDYGDASRA